MSDPADESGATDKETSATAKQTESRNAVLASAVDEDDDVDVESLMALYESKFADRYTDRDPEYVKARAVFEKPPPAVSPWYQRSKRVFDYPQAQTRTRGVMRSFHDDRRSEGGYEDKRPRYQDQYNQGQQSWRGERGYEDKRPRYQDQYNHGQQSWRGEGGYGRPPWRGRGQGEFRGRPDFTHYAGRRGRESY